MIDTPIISETETFFRITRMPCCIDRKGHHIVCAMQSGTDFITGHGTEKVLLMKVEILGLVIIIHMDFGDQFLVTTENETVLFSCMFLQFNY